MSKGIKILGLVFLVGVALFVLPWKNINWGRITLTQAQREVVTVTGEAKTQEKNQMADFSAGVNANNSDKQVAVNEVNQKIKVLVDEIKAFGISEEDIQTQNMSVYQNYYNKTANKKWFANNTLEITLRDVSKANDLADLLNKSGATSVYGPDFRMDDTSVIEKTLYGKAISDAREKAEAIAVASGRKLGKVVEVVDGGSSRNIMPMFITSSAKVESDEGAVTEPGSTEVSKSLTVSFELE